MNGLFRSVVLTVCVIGLAACDGESPDDDSGTSSSSSSSTSSTSSSSGSSSSSSSTSSSSGSPIVDDSFAMNNAIFYAGFEDGSEAADVGSEFIQNQWGGSGEPDFMDVIDNPTPSLINPSSKVMFVSLDSPGTMNRAEYHTQKSIPTIDQTYIYAWKEMFPSDFGEGITPGWTSHLVGQWKTWPCEFYGTGDYAVYAERICSNAGGIFNEREISIDGETLDFVFRAKPDCDSFYTPVPTKGEWHAYALEIFWTADESAGYYNIYEDGVLMHSVSGVKTLFDDLIPGTCNVQWGMGIYAWFYEGYIAGATLDYYFDDMAVFDAADGVTVEQVLDWQGFGD